MLTVAAKMSSSQVGEVPSSIDAVRASTSTTSAAPTRMINSCSAMSTIAKVATRSRLRAKPAPAMLRAAT